MSWAWVVVELCRRALEWGPFSSSVWGSRPSRERDVGYILLVCREMNMKINRSVLGLCLAMALVLVPGVAYAAPELKVGYVDMKRALGASKAGAEAQKRYEAEVKKAQASVDGKKKEVDALKDAYKKQRESLNEKARAEKEEQILSAEKELTRSFQDSKEKLRRENASLIGDLVKRIMSVVGTVGKEQGFTVILEKGGDTVLYADASIDLTDAVVKKFDSAQ